MHLHTNCARDNLHETTIRSRNKRDNDAKQIVEYKNHRSQTVLSSALYSRRNKQSELIIVCDSPCGYARCGTYGVEDTAL